LYLDIINEHADCRETILKLLNLLDTKYTIVRGNSPGLPVAGDAKTYNHLRSLKKEHSDDLKWLLPMPGDWHTLKNYQPLFRTVYSDAGLKQLAEASGFQSATLTALLASQNFHITHNFLMQSAEAILREMIQVFMKTQPSEKQELIKAYLANANISDRVFQDSITRTESLLHSCDLSTLFEAFNRFIIKQSTNDATWRFWKDFIFTDYTAYLALYVAIRTRH